MSAHDHSSKAQNRRLKQRGIGTVVGRRVAYQLLRLVFYFRNRGWLDLSVRILQQLIVVFPSILLFRIILARHLIAICDDPAVSQALDPANIDNFGNLRFHATRVAILHAQIGQLQLAAKYHQLAITTRGETLSSLRSTAIVFPEETDAIVNAYRKLSELDISMERRSDALDVIGNTLSDAGRDDAKEIFLEIIQKHPTCTSAFAGLVECEHISDLEHPVVQQMRQQLASTDITRMSQLKNLHFAMGHVYERAGDAPRAMTHYLVANSIRMGEGATTNVGALKLERKQIRKVFTKEFVDSMSAYGCQEDVLICVVGMPRSGTTLIHQVLGEAEKIKGLGELGDFARFITNLNFRFKQYPNCMKTLQPKEITKYATYLRNKFVAEAGPGNRVLIKLPDYYSQLGLIKILFPKTQIIHCKRDPVDNCLSCFSQNFGAITYSTDVYVLSEVYRSYLQMMFHWQTSVFPKGTIFDLCYEQMTSDPEGTVRKVCQFLNIEFDGKYLEFHKSHKPIATASRWQVRRPVYTSSVNRAAGFREFLGPIMTIDCFNPDPTKVDAEES